MSKTVVPWSILRYHTEMIQLSNAFFIYQSTYQVMKVYKTEN